MNRRIVQTKDFEDEILNLIKKRKLSSVDFEDFKRNLAANPEQGDVIAGTGGVRKVRLRSTAKGKSGGFRVCYLNIEDRLIIFFLFIYSKNEQENLTQMEKVELKQIVEAIKKRIRNE